MPGAAQYARFCGATLARAHARWGDRIAIASYLGPGGKFDQAIAEFSAAYADQNERDYQAFAAAVNSRTADRPNRRVGYCGRAGPGNAKPAGGTRSSPAGRCPGTRRSHAAVVGNERTMSRWIVQNVPAWWLVVLAVVVLPALAVLIQWLIRRRAPSLASGENNDAVGFLGATAAVVYAIIVGFMVITLWENYVAAGDTVENETSSLRDVVQFSGAFGPAAQNEIRRQVVQYAKSVTTMEWQAMAHGEDSPAAQMDFDRLITAVQGLRVRGPAQQEVLGNMLAQVDAAARERQRRLELSGPQIPAPMWLAVILTSVVTIAFCLLFEIKSARLRYFMVAAVVAVISAILVLSLLLEYPFSGSIEVKPTPFQHVAGELR